MKILHITAHMGGGAGKAVAGLAVSCNRVSKEEHQILLLECPQKRYYIEECEQNGTNVFLCEEFQEIGSYIEEADIVVVSWWQHPKMAEFLAKFPKIPCRIALWSHINGCVYPYLPYELTEQMDAVFFTTPYSLENPCWTKKQKEMVEQKHYIVSGMGDFKPALIVPKTDYRPKKSFTIGYIGTLNYAKLHADYFFYCQKVIEQIPDVRFLMVGDYELELTEKVKALRLESYFQFIGYAENVYQYMEQMDVMGYLLSSDNYATTENVLLEAMAFALPIVASNNRPEQYIIENGINGYLVHSAEEYVERIKELKQSWQLCEKIGSQARQRVIERCSVEGNREVFLQGLNQIMQKEKKVRDFSNVYGKTPYDWFLACTGKDRKFFIRQECTRQKDTMQKDTIQEDIIQGDITQEDIIQINTIRIEEFLQICNPTYKEASKSSIFHFASYFPEDTSLAYLSKKATEIRNQTPGGKRTPLYSVLPLAMPYLIQIFPVYGCNFRCGYCIHSLEREQHGYISDQITMDMGLFRKIVDDIKDSGYKIKMLRFAAIGEPLLHKDIAQMVAYAKEAEIAEGIDIVTNGSLLTKELSDQLIAAGLTRLRISLEGLSEKDYQKHADATIDFGQFVNNIRYFYEHCKNTKIYIKIIDYMVQKNIEQERFYRIFSPICHSIAIEHLTPTIRDIDYDTLSGNRKNEKPQNGEKLLESRICPQPFYMMQINPDGKVVPCCSMRYPVVLGDIGKKSVQDVWMGEDFQRFRRNMLAGVEDASHVCKECRLYLYDMHEEDRLDEVAEILLRKY